MAAESAFHPALPMPAPSLPPPPADVMDGVAALRIACVGWASQHGTSDHRAEVHACDATLGRDTQFAVGASLGVIATLTAVCFYCVCHSAVRAKTYGKAKEIAAYCLLAFYGVGPGLILGGAAVWQFGQGWSHRAADLALAGCVDPHGRLPGAAASAGANRAGGVTALTVPAVMALIALHGCVPPALAPVMVGIAQHESGLDPLAVRRNPNGTVDVGIAQVNSSNFGWLGLTAQTALDPCRNMAAALKVLFKDGGVFSMFEVDGLAAQTLDAAALYRQRRHNNHALCGLASTGGLVLHSWVCRGFAPASIYPAGQFRSRFAHDVRDEAPIERIRRLRQACDILKADLEPYRPRRLGLRAEGGRDFTEIGEALIFAMTGVWRPVGLQAQHRIGPLFSERIIVDPEAIEIRGPADSSWAACFGAKHMPHNCPPGALDGFLTASFRSNSGAIVADHRGAAGPGADGPQAEPHGLLRRPSGQPDQVAGPGHGRGPVGPDGDGRPRPGRHRLLGRPGIHPGQRQGRLAHPPGGRGAGRPRGRGAAVRLLQHAAGQLGRTPAPHVTRRLRRHSCRGLALKYPSSGRSRRWCAASRHRV